MNELCTPSGRPDLRARFRALIVRLAEIFSGQKITKNEEMGAILSELATLPGVRGSFLEGHVPCLSRFQHALSRRASNEALGNLDGNVAWGLRPARASFRKAPLQHRLQSETGMRPTTRRLCGSLCLIIIREVSTKIRLTSSFVC